MIGNLLARWRTSGPPVELYGAIVAQARQPAFYADLGVTDDVEGRFEMIVMHLVLVIDRMQQLGAPGRAAGQALFDVFFRDMDRSLREMGTGDLAVPKRIRRMAENVYGRADAYRGALAAADRVALEAAVYRNVRAAASGILAGYMLDSRRLLGELELGQILAGRIGWPPLAAPGAA